LPDPVPPLSVAQADSINASAVTANNDFFMATFWPGAEYGKAGQGLQPMSEQADSFVSCGRWWATV
jgi:hypothetical protein